MMELLYAYTRGRQVRLPKGITARPPTQALGRRRGVRAGNAKANSASSCFRYGPDPDLASR